MNREGKHEKCFQLTISKYLVRKIVKTESTGKQSVSNSPSTCSQQTTGYIIHMITKRKKNLIYRHSLFIVLSMIKL